MAIVKEVVEQVHGHLGGIASLDLVETPGLNDSHRVQTALG